MSRERPAIEDLLHVIDSDHLGAILSIDLSSNPSVAMLTTGNRPLIFAGVSEGKGPNSRTQTRVGVFVSGKKPIQDDIDPLSCDVFVLVRSPTQEEARVSTFPDKSTMRVVELLRPVFMRGRIQFRRMGITEPFVACG